MPSKSPPLSSPLMKKGVARQRGRSATGISGLDDILGGGLPSNRLYLLEGKPGTGKTTLALETRP